MSFIKKIFSGSGWAFFTMIIWEVIEELFENLIALGISNVLGLFIVKALSTIGIIIGTQLVKSLIKKFLFPFIKNLTYKEGYDKVEKVKTFFKKLGNAITSTFKYVCKSNPRASIATLLNGLVSYGVGYSINYDCFEFINNIPSLNLFGVDVVPYLIAIVLFIFIEFFGIKYAFETNKTADERKAQEKIQKEKKSVLKEASKKLKTTEKLATQTQAEQQKAQAKAAKKKLKKEAKDKAIAEHNAKVDKAMADLIAERNANKNNL